jgi:hypothetical protein
VNEELCKLFFATGAEMLLDDKLTDGKGLARIVAGWVFVLPPKNDGEWSAARDH